MSTVVLTHSLSAMGTIRQCIRNIPEMDGARVIGSYDDYSHGPLSRFESLDDFFDAREKFYLKFRQPLLPIRVPEKLAEHLPYIHPDFGEILSVDKLEFWSANSVQDEMFLIVALRILEAENFDLEKCSIRRIPENSPSSRFGGFTVAMMKEFYDRSQSRPVDLDLYRRTWFAVSGNSSKEIEDFANTLSDDLPLRGAMNALLRRFPECNHGLGSIDRALLATAPDQMKKSAYTVGDAMVLMNDTLDNIGDKFLFERLVDLANSYPDPWFEIEGDTHEMRLCSSRITDAGKAARQEFAIEPFRKGR